jgi:hypothetical protein
MAAAQFRMPDAGCQIGREGILNISPEGLVDV